MCNVIYWTSNAISSLSCITLMMTDFHDKTAHSDAAQNDYLYHYLTLTVLVTTIDALGHFETG